MNGIREIWINFGQEMSRERTLWTRVLYSSMIFSISGAQHSGSAASLEVRPILITAHTYQL
jgi:hypothetical protein